MRMYRIFAQLWKTTLGSSMLLLICLSAGCGKRVEYLNGEHKLTRLKTGQAAPRDGVLINEGYLSEIYQNLGQAKPSAEVLPVKDTSQAATPPITPK